MENEETYNGFWKQAGCLLSVIAILGIIAVIALAGYMFVKGF